MRNGRLNSTPIIALVLAAACWGVATVITKHVLTDVPPLTLLVLQLTVSVVFLWAIVLVQLREDVLGAQLWAVSLEHTMLTYFEVQPDSRFEPHQHESEQITFVLEGELFFEIAGQVIAVKAGEVIALPSSVPHAVFTREHAVRAVDAWSPVQEQYRR